MPPSPPCRVILLLDLDCFYAQCERVRLGLDASSAELVLLQWNSALAVTYPARRFGIKRGDSWEDVRSKSQGKCLALHLPILKADQTEQAASVQANVEEAYRQEYVLTEEQRRHIMEKEVGVKRHPNEGKACLERYRLASTRIFSILLETLNQKIGKNKFVLERASIDELFVDVTSYCWDDADKNDADERAKVMGETVSVGATESCHPHGGDRNVRTALERGCVVAKQIRDAVLQTLGFTLSAGISTSKLVAKLGASYGKPNGQAIILPQSIPKVMEETKIRKVRNFGGKVGKKVQALLPPEEETMGSIARLLSLPDLCRAMGPETGRRIFDACRGIDTEPVRETAGALVKSITAFKSFSRTPVTSDETVKWLSLLATDVVSRVEQDCARNQRYPQSLNIQYTFSKDDHKNERVSRSVRVPFPRTSDSHKKSGLVQRAREAVLAKEGSVFLHRIGLSASDFELRLRNGISSYFSKGSESEGKTKHKKSEIKQERSNDGEDCRIDEEFAVRPQKQSDGSNVLDIPSSSPLHVECGGSPNAKQKVCDTDKDLEFARRLQASYDREHRVLTEVESRAKKQLRVTDSGKPSKKMRIDDFFQKSK